MHTITWQAIDIPDEGSATRFPLEVSGRAEKGFAVCCRGELRAYLNRCPHNGSSLDWAPGRFFSEDGEVLVCQTHGALFAPDSGACLAGPCPRSLYPLPLCEQNGILSAPARMDTPTDQGLFTLSLMLALLPQMRPVKARGEKFGDSK